LEEAHLPEHHFADPGGVSIFVTVSGQRLNFSVGNVVIEGKSVVLPTGQRVNLSTGNVVIKIGQTVVLSGNQINLATNPVSVISWNPNTTRCESSMGPNRPR
jgi:hypothetical protein